MGPELLSVAGFLLLLSIFYRILEILYNIFYIYVLPKPINLHEKAGASWAVVTGSTDGIGKGYAFELASRGFNVFLVSRTQSKLDKTRQEILQKHSGIQVKTKAFDFKTSSPKDYRNLLEILNRVDIGILINNVGMYYEYPIEMDKVGIEWLKDLVVVDTLPPTLLTAGILPQMIARNRGVVVNIGSIAGNLHVPLLAAYSASKKYVEWLSSILRLEYSTFNVTIQTIAPFSVATNMAASFDTSFFVPDAFTFAKSALDTIGHTKETTGYIGHQIQLEVVRLLPGWLVDQIVRRRNEEKQKVMMANLLKTK